MTQLLAYSTYIPHLPCRTVLRPTVSILYTCLTAQSNIFFSNVGANHEDIERGRGREDALWSYVHCTYIVKYDSYELYICKVLYIKLLTQVPLKSRLIFDGHTSLGNFCCFISKKSNTSAVKLTFFMKFWGSLGLRLVKKLKVSKSTESYFNKNRLVKNKPHDEIAIRVFTLGLGVFTNNTSTLHT